MAVYRETVEFARAVGGCLIDPPLAGRLWPAEGWTKAEREGFAKCLADTAGLFPTEVRSTLDDDPDSNDDCETE